MSILGLRDRDAMMARPVYVPQAQPEPGVSVWRTLSAIGRATGEAAAQVGASVAEAVAGYGDVMGRIEEGESLSERAPDMQSDFADALRERGRDFRPDPTDAHMAEQVVYGFSRAIAKVGVGALAGPIGIVGMGLEESISVSDDLKREGVEDFPTRAKAATVQGAGLAIAALPLLGTTLPKTAALYLAGGPGGFVAQQALTREILQNGGYEQIAAQYDPLDPVGLTISALLPAVFTGVAIRGQRRVAAVSREVEDAARVLLQTERRQASNPAPDVPRMAEAHETALARAEDQIARGEPVQVADVAPRAAPADPVAIAEQEATVLRLDGQIAEAESVLQAVRAAPDEAAQTLPDRGLSTAETAKAATMARDLARAVVSADTPDPVAAIRSEVARLRQTVENSQNETIRARTEAAADILEFEAARMSGALKASRVAEAERTLEVVKARREDEARKLDAMRGDGPLTMFERQLTQAVREVQAEVQAQRPAPRAQEPTPDPGPRFRALTEGRRAEVQAQQVAARKRQAVLKKLQECIG